MLISVRCCLGKQSRLALFQNIFRRVRVQQKGGGAAADWCWAFVSISSHLILALASFLFITLLFQAAENLLVADIVALVDQDLSPSASTSADIRFSLYTPR